MKMAISFRILLSSSLTTHITPASSALHHRLTCLHNVLRVAICPQALIDLAKSKDKTVMYGVVSCLVNCTNTFDKNEALPEMTELAKFSKQHIPEEHEKVSVKFYICL